MVIDFSKLDEKHRKDENILHIILSGDKEFTPDSSMIMKVNGADEMVSGYEIFEALCTRLTKKRIDDGFSIEVRCGDNRGVDALAEMWCKRHKYIMHQHTVNWNNGASAAYRCAEDMFLFTGMKPHKGCLLLWDGENKLTRHKIFCAWMQGVPCRVWNYVEKSWMSANDIEDVQMRVREEQIHYGRIF